MAERKKAVTKKKTKGKPRGRNPVVVDNQKSISNPNNARYVAFIQELSLLPKVDVNDIQALENRLQEYLNMCVKYGMKVGNQACYFALGISKDQAYDWSKGHTRGRVYTDFIKKVKQICAMYREGLMQDGQINPVTGIFWQKNYDGLKDQQEVVLTPNNPLGDTTSPEELQKKYVEAVIDETPKQLTEPKK